MNSCIRKGNVLASLTLLLFIVCADSKGLSLKGASASILDGKWVVVEQPIYPLSIVPLCKPIQAGTTFHFSDDRLIVYTGSSKNPCDVFPFKISNKTISFIKEDMVWLCEYKLGKKSLKLVSSNFFTPLEAETAVPNQVVVTLKRK